MAKRQSRAPSDNQDTRAMHFVDIYVAPIAGPTDCSKCMNPLFMQRLFPPCRSATSAPTWPLRARTYMAEIANIRHIAALFGTTSVTRSPEGRRGMVPHRAFLQITVLEQIHRTTNLSYNVVCIKSTNPKLMPTNPVIKVAGSSLPPRYLNSWRPECQSCSKPATLECSLHQAK